MKYKNNPANIRSGSRWLGLSGSTNGFCEFDSLEFGVRALLYILHKYYYIYRLHSVASIINRFAPPSENDTIKYIYYVRNVVASERSFDDRFPLIFYVALAICFYETHTQIDIKYFAEIYSKYIHQFPKYNEKKDIG